MAILGCTGSARDATRIDERSPGIDLKRVAATVTRVRGLSELRPTTISVVDDKTFVEALRESPTIEGIGDARDAGGGNERLYGAARLLAEEARAIERQETMGFYDPDRRTIFLRRPTRGEKNSLPISWVLAHEMGHALQHQHFPLLEGLTSGDSEARLSYRALLEGDATITMLAYAAESSWLPLNRVVANALGEIERGNVTNVTHMGHRTALSIAPPLVRERFLFPYTAGTAFVAQIQRAGGFDLVNRVYRRPPVTTEQVLHPQKYLDGETAMEFGDLPVPEGAQTMARGHFGELHVRGLLEPCVGRDEAKTAAAGWGGDAFTIAQAGDRTMTLWNTVWDTEADAEEFESAVTECFTRDAEDAVMRRGARVSVLMGLPPSEMDAMHERLLEVPFRRTSAPAPMGVVLRPFRRVAKVGLPYVVSGRYVDPRLGIQVPVPRGFSARAGGRSLFAEQRGRVGLLVVGLSEWVVTTESVRRLYSDLSTDIERHLHGKRLDVVSNSKTNTPLGPGLERTWVVHGSRLSVRMMVAPICSGVGAIVYLMMWADAPTEAMLHAAVAGTGSTAEERPVCAELDP